MKDLPAQWKVLVTQKKGTNPKEQEELGPTMKTRSPTENKRKEIEHAKGTRGSKTTIKTRQKHTIPKPLV